MKNRVLFVANQVPPLAGSHGLRVINIIKYMTQFGWGMDVLTVSPSPNFPNLDRSSVEEIPSSVRIFRTSLGLSRKIYHGSIRNKSVSSHFHWGEKASFKSRFFSFVNKAARSISKLAIPDVMFEWYPFGVVQGVKLIRSNKYDILLSTGYPWTSHLIAYTLRRFKRMAWVVDYSDPWVFAPSYRHNKLKFWIEHRMETNILKSADAVVVTTEETKRNYLENYLFLRPEKVYVIPIGYDHEAFQDARVERGKKFRLVHPGALMETYQVIPFLRALKKVSENEELKANMEVIFIGNIDEEYRKVSKSLGLGKIISFRPFMPPKEIPGWLLGANVMLLFGHKGGMQVPGKIASYIAARRPVLCITGDERDAAPSVVRGLNRGVVVDGKVEDIYSAIVELYHLYERNELDNSFDLRDMPGLSWKERVETLSHLCEQLIGNE